MLKRLIVMAAVVSVSSMFVIAEEKENAPACKAGDTVYACTACNVVDTKAGKCTKCQAELKAMRMLEIKDGKASLCECAKDCKCTVKADDPKQCSCGKTIAVVDCPKAAKTDEAKKTDPDKAKPKDHPAH